MKICKPYDPNRTYMYPNGEIATPERVLKDYPAVEFFDFIIETDSREEMIFAMDNLSGLRDMYGISDDLNRAESVRAIQDKINRQAELVEEQSKMPGIQERIAAAMEFQNLLNM